MTSEGGQWRVKGWGGRGWPSEVPAGHRARGHILRAPDLGGNVGFAAGAVGATGGFGQEEGLPGTGVSAVRPASGV